tara:strand:- start:22464 stop:23726 length:1263 start_codon:yes stop_codon:yes gene_type:complete
VSKIRVCYCFFIFLISFSFNVYAESSFIDALTGGKIDFGIRLRYESVEDDSKASGNRDADALTNRTTLGYKTGSFHNVFAHIEFENVTDILDDTQYNDGENGLTALPVIADSRGTEINQAYLGLKFIDKTTIKIGRQALTPRKAPFHRFLGTVLWRQNWQTQDAVIVTNTSFKDTEIMVGYIWKNNTIFGTDRDMEAPIFNAKYDGFRYAKLEGYYYDLDFTESADLANASTTYGLRAHGVIPVINDKTKFIYTGEFARQSDTGSNSNSYDADYYLAEGGFKVKLNNFVTSILVKASYEVLETDKGTQGTVFRTPLATGHAYQGWTDNFLLTPAAGIEDTYFTMVATGKYDTKLIVSYHMLEAESAGFDYGDEIDIWLTRKLNKKYTVGLKYAVYDASSDAGNTKASDLSRFWAYVGYQY